MLPHANDKPAALPEATEIALIPLAVASNFSVPILGEFFAPLWKSPSVPEVTIDEHDHPGLGEDHIWTPGQLGEMNAKPEPAPMGQSAQNQFGRGVLASHSRHHVAALLRREVVSHGGSPFRYSYGNLVARKIDLNTGDSPRVRASARAAWIAGC